MGEHSRRSGLMDDKIQAAVQESAQEARDKGAALEYDTADEDALDAPAPPADRNAEPPLKEEK